MEQNTITAIGCLIGLSIEIILIVFGISVIKTIHQNDMQSTSKETVEVEDKTLEMMQTDVPQEISGSSDLFGILDELEDSLKKSPELMKLLFSSNQKNLVNDSKNNESH